ncbi:MBL fold metallo-hydrolase [Gordonia sp. ABSL1-1]|uniref:MBL fold metallo-hydrolase n=1 Tax=Gordonia sp. ABSL1-1 TaxID=3053923 RepID=UPI002572EF39|nr:MBL fold metallo-hydrolase [Gordonia sp. ABSL1-1]MDL9938009.1 MBL fold metallo-hydrolase [Gordonia sp. ABSL1-1]
MSENEGRDRAARAPGRVTTFGVAMADAAVGRLAAGGLRPARALGASREQIEPHVDLSPHRNDGAFANPEPQSDVAPDLSAFADMLRSPGRPRKPIMVTVPTFDAPAALAVTWLGHATALVDIDGVRVLTDPVLSRRCSPSQLVGPGRMHRAPLEAGQLPPVDVVLISHDHYDHLDMATVVDIAARQPEAVFVAPVGVGAHLVSWGIAAERIRQADWGDTVSVRAPGATLDFTCGPARHFSGRWLARNLTQWASWAVCGPAHRIFFSGDTGYTERFADLGAALGPFDVTLIAVGAYDPLWPDIHVNPEEAVAIHRMLSGSAGTDSVLIPIHWGTFNLARHSWSDPIVRLLPHAERNATTVLVPQPGGTIDLERRAGTGVTRPTWWEASA